MGIIGSSQFLERLQFFNGQRLFATDLQTLESFNREMRWLHNQSLHQPGVGSGYAVAGNKGDRQITIAPGYALDACGREIVLTEQQVEPVPPVADDGSGGSVFYDLTVSYPTDADLVETETRMGVCVPQGATRLREAPNFCWIQLGATLQPIDPQLKIDVQSNMRIVLARAEVRNCQLYQPLSTVQRRNARPNAQPHVACGSTDPAATVWRLGPLAKSTKIITLQVDIDTSAEQFQKTPCYSAQLVGNRLFDSAKLPSDLKSKSALGTFVLDGLTGILDPTPTGFTFQLTMPPLGTDFNPSSFLSLFKGNTAGGNAVLQTNQWSVTWMGVES
ncbi:MULTISPECIES: hypothetical protein [unclassified Burkholderia]|uniref:hypothetical protein n=1 Tax=unclassified Burkholderia TaxID=2613784 RepID=UPI00141DA51B|nr:MULTISPECIES: hypothetical protein [unclassified Burkholderia]NIE61727.1 hypothetical protein [Burkholderia sp. Ap-955]NIF14241.1 hypothetical protein [Burkholderia sp. Ax-1735]NIG07442.1 hypothetical protein [Burkholderia sp. Tr-849]